MAADDFDPAAYLAAKRAAGPARPPAQAKDGDDFDPGEYLAHKRAASRDIPIGVRAPDPEPGAWDRAKQTLGALKDTAIHGGAALVEGARHPIDTLTDAAKRHQFEKGFLDVATLGYGNRLAARIGNALGDVERGESIDETKHFSRAASAGDTTAPSRIDADERERAGNFRALGNLAGTPFGAGRAAGMAGGVAGKLLPTVSNPLMAAAMGAGRGAVAYEATAPAMAALSADAEGHRLEAAKEAMTDPAGLAMAVGGGALTESAAAKLAASKGAQARRLIEERGRGARVGLTTPGAGGVFDRELAGLKADDHSIGLAAKRGARGILDAVENQHEEETGIPYRGARDVLKDARATAREQVGDARQAVRDASRERAQRILDQIVDDHRVETSEPYRKLKAAIDNSPAAQTPRDVAHIVSTMQDAAFDLDTAPHVRGQLEEQLRILERYRDPNTGAVMVPERQLNGLRRTLMRAARVGTTDAPGEAEAPLRRAAFAAKQMVDQGPYAVLNDFYRSGAEKMQARRQAVGLKARSGKDQTAEVARLAKGLQRSVNDPSLLEAAGAAADMSDVRTQLAKARGIVPDAERRVALAAAAAAPDREALGLAKNIGSRKTDVNQLRLALQREAENTTTAGGSQADLAAFRKRHPELAVQLDAAALAKARADLSFRALPKHGGPIGRAGEAFGPAALAWAAVRHPLATAAGLAAQNATPLAGRVLQPLLQDVNGGAVGARAAVATNPLIAAARAKREQERAAAVRLTTPSPGL